MAVEMVSPSSGIGTVRTARSAEEVEQLRSIWSTFRIRDMDADIDYFTTVVQSSPAVRRPHVVLVERAGEAPLLIVARLVRQRFGLKLGYQVPWSMHARALVVAFEGFLGVETEKDARDALSALTWSARGEADVMVVQKTQVDGPLARVLRHQRGCHRRVPQVLWTADLPGSWDDLLTARGAKSRRQLRYDDSKVRKRLGDRLRVQMWDQSCSTSRAGAAESGALEGLVHAMSQVAETSYQHALGVSFSDDPVQHALLQMAADRGWLRVAMVHIDERPAAFWWGIAYDGTLTIMSPGFDPEFAAERVGLFAFRRMLEALCADPEVHRVSFGPGDAEYKQRFGTRSEDVADFVLGVGTLRGAAARGTTTVSDLVNTWGREVLERRGATEKWRKRLRAGRTDRGRPSAD